MPKQEVELGELVRFFVEEFTNLFDGNEEKAVAAAAVVINGIIAATDPVREFEEACAAIATA